MSTRIDDCGNTEMPGPTAATPEPEGSPAAQGTATASHNKLATISVTGEPMRGMDFFRPSSLLRMQRLDLASVFHISLKTVFRLQLGELAQMGATYFRVTAIFQQDLFG